MMFDLNNNAFFKLGVTPDANEHDIVEAFEDVVSEHPEKEHELQSAQNNLRVPKKRLREELTYLWGVSPEQWLDLLSSTPECWGGLTEVAKMNLAAHYCCFAPKRTIDLMEKTFDALIRGRGSYTKLFDDITASRNNAQLPSPQEGQYQEALEAVSVMHRKASMYAVEKARHGGKLMTKVVETWRFDSTEAGRFVMDLCRDYDKWTITKLRPIEENIDSIIEILRNETTHSDLPWENKTNQGEDDHQMELDELDQLLKKWDEFSQPVQLVQEVKGLDEPRSKEIYNKLRTLALDLNNKFGMSKQSLRISQALLNTFPELPGAAGLLATDVKTLKGIAKREESTKEIKAWFDKVNKIKANPANFADDIEFRVASTQWPERAASFIRMTEKMLKSYGQDETVWYCLMSLAVAIFEYGRVQTAYSLFKIIEVYASQYGAPRNVRERLSANLSNLTNFLNARPQPMSGTTKFVASVVGYVIGFGAQLIIVAVIVGIIALLTS